VPPAVVRNVFLIYSFSSENVVAVSEKIELSIAFVLKVLAQRPEKSYFCRTATIRIAPTVSMPIITKKLFNPLGLF
jgi:hypothetical protein